MHRHGATESIGAQDLAVRYLLDLSRQIQSAALVELEPKQGVSQRSTLILLKGSINRFTFFRRKNARDGEEWEGVDECFGSVATYGSCLCAL